MRYRVAEEEFLRAERELDLISMQVIGKAVSSDELTKREKSRGLRKNRSPEEEEERASERALGSSFP